MTPQSQNLSNKNEETHSPSPSGDWIIAYCDGGSRGNPGPSGFGVRIEDASGKVLGELSQYLGIKTNNFAEYSGLLAAIDFAVSHGHRRLRVVSDSELMVKQMKGQYRVNSPDLRPLWEHARQRTMELDQFEIQHVLREKNRHADRLANLAMDRGTGKANAAPVPATQPQRENHPQREQKTTSSAQTMLRGFVKGGVVHILGGELPDGVFVKVILE